MKLNSSITTQDELGLNRELMFKLSPQKRWELYLSKQQVYIYIYEYITMVYVCVIWYHAWVAEDRSSVLHHP